MKLYALFAPALVAGLWSNPGEAATKAFACNGCSPMQEEQKALASQGRGYLFVYNVAGNRIRKFEIVVFAGGTNALSPDAKAGGVRIVATDQPPEGAAAEAGVIRELWEYQVDPGVREIFDAIVAVERQAPGFIEGKNEVNVPIRNIGQTVGTLGPRAFDPREIAWNSGTRGGEYRQFMNQLTTQLGGSTSAYAVHPEVGRALYGVFFRLGGVGVSFSGGGFGISISFERLKNPLKLKLCDTDGNCVLVKVKIEGDDLELTYEGAFDKFDTPLQTESTAFSMRWLANGREGANAYAQYMRNVHRANVDFTGGNQYGCNKYVLACTQITGTNLLACQIHCY